MIYNQDISLDLNINVPYQVVSAKQGDNISRTLTITILKDGDLFDMPSNIKASYRIRKPDNYSSWNDAQVYPSEHKVIITLTSADLAVAGRCYADILFTVGTAQIGTASFILNVQQIPNIVNNVLGSNEFEHLENLINQANKVIQHSNEGYVKEEVIVELFNQNKTYFIGDYVIQNGNLFKCIQNTTAGTAWNDSNWLQITVMSQINDLYEVILNSSDNLQDQIDDLQDLVIDNTNNLQGQITNNTNNLQGQINDLIDDLNYVALSISTYTISPVTAETGSTVNNILIRYTFNKKPETITINDVPITPAVSGTYELSNQNLTKENNRNYNLNVTDKGSPSHSSVTITRVATVQFYNRICWGASEIPQTLNSEFVRNLDFALSGSKSRTFTVTAGAGQYIWFALPVSIGQVNFKVGNFDGGFNPPDIISVADAGGEAVNYYVYRSTNANLGKTTVVVS